MNDLLVWLAIQLLPVVGCVLLLMLFFGVQFGPALSMVLVFYIFHRVFTIQDNFLGRGKTPPDDENNPRR